MEATGRTGPTAAQGARTGYELPEEFERRVMSPALVIYLDRVRQNLRTVIAQAGDVDRWRPHVKTSKIPAVFRELCRAGLRNFKCATTREAHELLKVLRDESVGRADLLIAYPVPEPALTRLGRLAAEYDEVRLSVLCEAAELVDTIPKSLSVFVDVNPGMHRTGIPLERYDAILEVARLAGPRFRGVHFYDGHLHQDDVQARAREALACYDRLMELQAQLRRDRVEVGEVVTSGTPTYRHALAYPGFEAKGAAIHRVSPGTVVYHDLRSLELDPTIGLFPAALVHTRVVSHPRDGFVTCDAGSKSIAAEAGDPAASVLGHPGLVAETPSEEHLPLRVESGPVPPRGTCLQLFPRHVCPTVNLADRAVLMDGADVVDVVDVSARAHELLFED